MKLVYEGQNGPVEVPDLYGTGTDPVVVPGQVVEVPADVAGRRPKGDPSDVSAPTPAQLAREAEAVQAVKDANRRYVEVVSADGLGSVKAGRAGEAIRDAEAALAKARQPVSSFEPGEGLLASDEWRVEKAAPKGSEK